MKNTLRTLLLLSGLFPALLFAQPAIEWKHCYGGSNDDDPVAIFQTNDGSYVIAGESQSSDFQVKGHHGGYNSDAWIIKVKTDGSLEWEKSIGGSKDERLYSCIKTKDGGFIFTGSTTSKDGDLISRSNATDSSDAWICKLNEAGSIQWIKTYGGAGWDGAYSIAETKDGGYVIAGDTAINSSITSTGWIFKIDSIGSVQWSTVIPNVSLTSVVPTSGAGYMLTGNTSTNKPGYYTVHGLGDIWVGKLTPLGKIDWQNVYGGRKVMVRGESLWSPMENLKTILLEGLRAPMMGM